MCATLGSSVGDRCTKSIPLACATSLRWMVSLALAPLPTARALRTMTATTAAMNARVTMRRFTTSTISAGGVVGLVRPLRLDHDHAVRPARPVDRRCRQILERGDGLDVMGIEPAERAVRARLDGDPIDDEERILARIKRCRATDAHRDSAAWRGRHHHAGDPPRQQLLE